MGPFLLGESVQDWPELIGKPIQYAIDEIRRTRPGATVELVRQGTSCTEDYSESRVRVYNDGSRVTTLPSVG